MSPDPSPEPSADPSTEPSTEPSCLFCRMASGEIRPDVVHETDTTLAFRDIDPQAPTHVLVIPRPHHRDLAALAAQTPDLLADLAATIATVVGSEHLDAYRVVFNTGAEAGQRVFHVHAHVLGGRRMGWPPG